MRRNSTRKRETFLSQTMRKRTMTKQLRVPPTKETNNIVLKSSEPPATALGSGGSGGASGGLVPCMISSA